MGSPTMDNEATLAFLFQCGDSTLFAVTRDATGNNLPASRCADGWVFRERVLLSVRKPAPLALELEALLQGIDAKGYHVARVIKRRPIDHEWRA